jgi:hypothetical protein
MRILTSSLKRKNYQKSKRRVTKERKGSNHGRNVEKEGQEIKNILRENFYK